MDQFISGLLWVVSIILVMIPGFGLGMAPVIVIKLLGSAFSANVIAEQQGKK